MNDFKWKHFRGEIILGCVRWYCKYGISYRDLEEMMLERGIEVDHTTLFRWVQQYAPEIEKRLRWYYKPGLAESWKVDETYVKVKGKWKYLYRAIRGSDSNGTPNYQTRGKANGRLYYLVRRESNLITSVSNIVIFKIEPQVTATLVSSLNRND